MRLAIYVCVLHGVCVCAYVCVYVCVRACGTMNIDILAEKQDNMKVSRDKGKDM